MDTFSVASRFPNRRRVAQACVTCRDRKTRCDATQPRCGYCAKNNVTCTYRDSQQPRIDYNTQVILENIQLLEERIAKTAEIQPHLQVQDGDNTSPSLPGSTPADLDVQIALSHTANANHVYNWPIVQDLLSEVHRSETDQRPRDATDIFFEHNPQTTRMPGTWNLLDDQGQVPAEYRALIDIYFAQVNGYHPLLNKSDVVAIYDGLRHGKAIDPAHYALLILVLCFASFLSRGANLVRIQGDRSLFDDPAEEQLWGKARLLLGFIFAEVSLAAAQCAMLASLYRGAKGRVAESFHWSHAASVKCEALARQYTHDQLGSAIPDQISRVFWIAFIYEGDFVSEISVNLPSGMARYEELIPYPTVSTAADGANAASDPQQEVVAFQITTNASTRRFLNRVNSAIYNVKEAQRKQLDRGPHYPAWLLSVTQDLWSHHSTVYKNLPEFLLRSEADSIISPRSVESPTARIEGLSSRGNNPWNILRLKGRYYAGMYIIHRPFVEYALLNEDHLDRHPYREAILNNAATCLAGCGGFIRVFDYEPANSISCLFATGMVTFAMTLISMIATVSRPFVSVLPADIEESIVLGVRNLKRFSLGVPEFAWHLQVLEEIEVARQNRKCRQGTG
ncbi:oleate-activated transcription factor 1 [Emericellopsis cladophorae]|uniref:Oleate-activated transcription factor 1 n=1 Tax=Emericellopsis cladophorae TaxID=2686198 RepID=A0A9Q0BCH9_9HYPO|nr:oleate-activated transcription factor 1 [Emericellopsis cladophorae]KAI6780842.1 oleate-activated transcription factor 1 [Emericellopsis cladophorae]